MVALERREGDEGAVRGSKRPEGFPQAFGGGGLFDALDGSLAGATSQSRARQRGEERPVPAQAAGRVARQVGGSDEEPSQRRALDQPHRLAPTPQLQKGAGGDVLGVVRVGDQPEGVEVHAVSVEVEHGGEGLSVAAQRGGPELRLAAGQLHDLQCPNLVQRYTTLGAWVRGLS
jgi:hypothetical protein